MTPVRFKYRVAQQAHSLSDALAYLPITLETKTHSLEALALLDSGSTVNVLPYSIGVQLGLVWDEHKIPIYLTGSLARLPAKGVVITGKVATFSAVDLAFAWTQAIDIPIILGQMNFFSEFHVCFFRFELEFEINRRYTDT